MDGARRLDAVDRSFGRRRHPCPTRRFDGEAVSDQFCFGCHYPGEEHFSSCEHYVSVDQLRAQLESSRDATTSALNALANAERRAAEAEAEHLDNVQYVQFMKTKHAQVTRYAARWKGLASKLWRERR